MDRFMTNLFIIGNGFDIAHGMKTKYSDFRNFLIKTYLDGHYDEENFANIPQWFQLPDGDIEYSKEDVVNTTIRILDQAEGDLWKNIETSLGVLDFDEYFDDYDINDKNIDYSLKETYNNNEDNANNLCGALEKIPLYFQDWVANINPAKVINKDFQELIDSNNDLFLTFNYTNTLEKIYNAKNVCHIHGDVKNNIYFGHGNTKDKTNEYEIKYFGAERELINLQNELLKDVNSAYNNHLDFFNKLKTISNSTQINIYSFGFSFSSVDSFYLKKICELIDS